MRQKVLKLITVVLIIFFISFSLKAQENGAVTNFSSTTFQKLIYLEKQDLIAGIKQDKHLCFFNADYTYTNVSFDSVAEIIEYQGDLYLFQEVVELKCDTIPVYYLDDTEPDTSETIVKYYNELTAYKLIKYNPDTKTTSYLGVIKEIDPEYIYFEFQDSNLLSGKNRWGDVLFEIQITPWKVKTNPEPEAPIQLAKYFPVYYKNSVLKNDTVIYFLSLYENPYESKVEYFLMRYSFNLKIVTDTISLGKESKFHKVNDSLLIEYMVMDVVWFDDFGEENYSIMSNFTLKQILKNKILEIDNLDIVAKQVNATVLIDDKLLINIQNKDDETETYMFNMETKNFIKLK